MMLSESQAAALVAQTYGRRPRTSVFQVPAWHPSGPPPAAVPVEILPWFPASDGQPSSRFAPPSWLPAAGRGHQYHYHTGGGGSIGLGLFDSTDFQDWGFAEWFVVAAAGYFLFSLFQGTRRVAAGARSAFSKGRRRAQRRRELQRALAEA